MAKQRVVEKFQYTRSKHGIGPGSLVREKGRWGDAAGIMLVLCWNPHEKEWVVVTDDHYIMGVKHKDLVQVKNQQYWAICGTPR